MANKVNRLVAETFLDIAKGLETGSFGKRPKIAVTGIGSEHGEENVMAGAVMAANQGVDVYYIGTLENEKVNTVYVDDEAMVHKTMEKLLDEGTVDGAVTMHYPFPIGVSTVGRVVTPGKGKPMYIANTTGTSSTDRIEGMVRNAVYGIIAAKACGIKEPTLGIANVDGARQCEIALKKLVENGYPINFAESARADGGCVMRGNDILGASADIMVTDSLTGNLFVKLISAFTTGGSYEASGWGYGPGIGENWDRLVMIVSRASGAPVIGGALCYAAELVKGDWKKIVKEELDKANKAGLKTVAKPQKKEAAPAVEVVAPPKEIVTAAITGVEVMDLDDAVNALWAEKIYAESGMGCTGPVILVSDANLEKASEVLKKAGYVGE